MKLKNSPRFMASLLMLLLVALLMGCKEPTPKVEGKYTVWVGSAAVAVGYETDEYAKANGMITFVNKRTGKTITSPVCSIWQIERN